MVQTRIRHTIAPRRRATEHDCGGRDATRLVAGARRPGEAPRRDRAAN